MIRMNSMRTGACVAVIAAAGCGVTQAAVPEGRSAAPAERTAESTERRSTDVTAFVRALQDSHGGDGGDRMLLSVEQIAERSDRVVLGRIVSVKRGADVQTSIPDYLRGTGTVPWVIAVIDAEVVVERSAGADESLVTLKIPVWSGAPEALEWYGPEAAKAAIGAFPHDGVRAMFGMRAMEGVPAGAGMLVADEALLIEGPDGTGVSRAGTGLDGQPLDQAFEMVRTAAER